MAIRTRVKKEGFTLIEVLLAAVILVIIAIGLFAAFVAAKNWAARNVNKVKAINYAQETAEWLKNCVTANTDNQIYQDYAGNYALEPGDHGSNAHPLPGDDPFVANFDAERTYKVERVDVDGNGTWDVSKVSITVTWSQP